MFRYFGDIMTPYQGIEIKMRVQKELKYFIKFAWMKDLSTD